MMPGKYSKSRLGSIWQWLNWIENGYGTYVMEQPVISVIVLEQLITGTNTSTSYTVNSVPGFPDPVWSTHQMLWCINRQQAVQIEEWTRVATYIICHMWSTSYSACKELLTLPGKRIQTWTLAPIGTSILLLTTVSDLEERGDNHLGSPHRVGLCLFWYACSEHVKWCISRNVSWLCDTFQHSRWDTFRLTCSAEAMPPPALSGQAMRQGHPRCMV